MAVSWWCFCYFWFLSMLLIAIFVWKILDQICFVGFCLRSAYLIFLLICCLPELFKVLCQQQKILPPNTLFIIMSCWLITILVGWFLYINLYIIACMHKSVCVCSWETILKLYQTELVPPRYLTENRDFTISKNKNLLQIYLTFNSCLVLYIYDWQFFLGYKNAFKDKIYKACYKFFFSNLKKIF